MLACVQLLVNLGVPRSVAVAADVGLLAGAAAVPLVARALDRRRVRAAVVAEAERALVERQPATVA